MTAYFDYPTIKISCSSEVFKSEDGEFYSFLYSGGEYTDANLCIPSEIENSNYYFYSGDSQICTVAVKKPLFKV